jgi:hypothetical protein
MQPHLPGSTDNDLELAVSVAPADDYMIMAGWRLGVQGCEYGPQSFGIKILAVECRGVAMQRSHFGRSRADEYPATITLRDHHAERRST